MTSNRVLIIDDDTRLTEMLAEYLAPEGLSVTAYANGSTGLREAQTGEYDLIVLDVMLPGLSGFEVLRQLRESGSETPVLMLTARGDDVDRIVGLEMGADDYLPKPFNPRELLARIKAVLRRTAESGPLTVNDSPQALRFGHWRLDLARRELLNEKGVTISLSTAEFDLLRVFTQHPNRVLSRDQLLDLARGREAQAFDRAIDTLV